MSQSDGETFPDGGMHSFEPLAFHAEQSNNDTLCYRKAQNGPRLCRVKKNYEKETNYLCEKKNHRAYFECQKT